jgi:hypothetical protein
MDVRPTEVLDDRQPPQRELWLWFRVLLVLALAGGVAAWLVTRTGDGTAGTATRAVTPPAPRAAQPARTIAITTKTPAPPAALPTVPNVVGEDEKTAKRALSDAGFHAQVERQRARGRGKGKAVVGQKPAAGAHAQTGTTVTIHMGRDGHEGD